MDCLGWMSRYIHTYLRAYLGKVLKQTAFPMPSPSWLYVGVGRQAMDYILCTYILCTTWTDGRGRYVSQYEYERYVCKKSSGAEAREPWAVRGRVDDVGIALKRAKTSAGICGPRAIGG